MVTYTTTYNLKKPTVADDEDVWGGYLNDSMDLIDDVLDGTTPVTGIDINSGTIDNAVIGGTTPVAGTFTALTANTSLGVTGNITVSGTVDGRDVAADGTKLDGIESGATADQTKADIDALGIAASTAATLETARNIALSGDVSGNVNFDGSGNVTITTTVADDSHNHVISNVDGLQTALDAKLESSSYTASDVLTKIKTVDGSGSGLDADLWDGNQFSSYLNQAVLTYSSPTFSTAYIHSYIYHASDTNTYLGFANRDDFLIVVGGRQIIRCDEGTDPDKIQFYDANNFINTNGVFQVAGTSQSAAQIEGYSALSGTTPSIDVTSAGAFSLTMSGNTTFTFTGATSGKSQGFVLQLTGNGSTVTWPTSVDWAGGTAPDAPASGEADIYVFWTRDGGATWYGVQSIDAAA